MRKIFQTGVFLVLIMAGLMAWYSIAANYGYEALSGTYTLNRAGEKCTLYLRPDQTFTEELERDGTTINATGHWRRYGEAHASFSREFIKLSGQDESAGHEADGQFDKAFGLFPSLMFAPIPGGPRLQRKLLR
jgi:hypothetical protein